LRILVINVNRSGSTNFCKGLSKYFGVKYYPSPEREYVLHQPKELDFYKNNPNIHHKRTLNNTFESLSEVCSIYDNIILLSRRNLNECVESWAYISTMRDNPNVKFGSHTSRYVWEKTDNYEEVEEELYKGNRILENLSSAFNIPITYYEDLYYTNSKETIESLNLGIKYDEFKQYLDTSKRQRRYNVKNLL
jgi:hypothetical protein